VQTIHDVRNDPQLAHRGLFVGVEGFEDAIRVPRLPLLFDGVGSTAAKVPALGEHTPKTP
jgi:crotonobetainyl-CoA:carnitine CoA-transferase CaiB-like acyl-CoA transferase